MTICTIDFFKLTQTKIGGYVSDPVGHTCFRQFLDFVAQHHVLQNLLALLTSMENLSRRLLERNHKVLEPGKQVHPMDSNYFLSTEETFLLRYRYTAMWS